MIIKNIKHRIKLWLNNTKVAYRFDVLIEKGVTIKYIDSIVIGKNTTLQSGVYLYGSRSKNKVVIGSNVVIGMNCALLGEGGIDVDDGTHFGPNVIVTTQYGSRINDENLDDEATNLKYQSIRLGKRNWIGAGSIVMPGVVLGDNCSVAPNSVVFGKWGDNVMLVGAPARRRKY